MSERETQVALLWRVCALLRDLEQLGQKPIPALTVMDMGRVCVSAGPVRREVLDLIDELNRVPYLSGSAPVLVSGRGGFASPCYLVDGDGLHEYELHIVPQDFASPDEAEEYARSHGMRLVEAGS